MPKKYKNIEDQIIKNSIWNGECLESTFKVCKDSPQRRPYFTHKRKMYSVTREWWKIHKGEIPEGMHICHHCDNPLCFRIEHLFLGTPSDNMQDMVRKRRDNTFGNRKYPLEFLEKAIEMREKGMSYKEIAIQLNAKRSAISSLIIRHRMKKCCIK